MATTKGIVIAVHYGYTGGKISSTDVCFNDGTELELDGHWVFEIGRTYRIEHSGENPATVQKTRIVEML